MNKIRIIQIGIIIIFSILAILTRSNSPLDKPYTNADLLVLGCVVFVAMIGFEILKRYMENE